MSKRSLSIFAIILLLLFSSLQFVSCGEDSSLKFTLSTDKSGYFVSSIGSFDGSDLVIPSEYRGKPVIGISIEAFYGATNLKSVVIPDSVTRINDYSFAGCTELTSLTLPQNLNYIGNHSQATFPGFTHDQSACGSAGSPSSQTRSLSSISLS